MPQYKASNSNSKWLHPKRACRSDSRTKATIGGGVPLVPLRIELRPLENGRSPMLLQRKKKGNIANRASGSESLKKQYLKVTLLP